MKRSKFILLLETIVVSTLAFSCQGLNDNKIDPVLLAHAKSIIDFDTLKCNSMWLQVVQYDCKTAWLYFMYSYFGDMRHDTGKLCAEDIDELPTDLIEYKGKYILFFLRNKKELSLDMLCKVMNLEIDERGNPIIPVPKHCSSDMDFRTWFYYKDKTSSRSTFVKFDDDELEKENVYPMCDCPQLRYFLCDSQDSALYYSHIIDMQMELGPYIYGMEKHGEKFLYPDQIKFTVGIRNKSDSALYLSTSPAGYGHFVVKNGKHSLPCHVEKTRLEEVSPHLYKIAPHSEGILTLSTEKAPIVFEHTRRTKYPEKMHQLVYDSIYYLPVHTPPMEEKRQIWNKRFKVFSSYTRNYAYRIGGIEYTAYWDGDIEESSNLKYRE